MRKGGQRVEVTNVRSLLLSQLFFSASGTERRDILLKLKALFALIRSDFGGKVTPENLICDCHVEQSPW